MMMPIVYKERWVPRQQAIFPAMIIAAVAVSLFSLAGIASMAGQSSSATEEHARALAKSCRCGVVESIKAREMVGDGSGLGTVIGGVAGAVLGNSMGSGDDRAAMTVIGVGAGALAGNALEKRSTSYTIWQTTIRLDSGALHTYDSALQPTWAVGSRVKLENGRLLDA